VNDSDRSQSPDLRGHKPFANCATAIPLRFATNYFFYIFVSVKLPEPVQPDCAPVKVHAPEMVLLFTLP
jgi:hypothetical protein